LQRAWKTQERNNAENILPSPIHIWNIKCNSYLRLQNHLPAQTWIINYETLLANANQFIEDLTTKANLKELGSFKAIEDSKKNDDNK